MVKIAVVYHSEYGHTDVVAQHVAKGVNGVDGATAVLITADAAMDDMDQLAEVDAVIFGSPTYLGSVSAKFKAFMDASSGIWFNGGWKDKIAAAFTVGGSMSGDKLAVLMQLCIFAAQHGMVWVGQSEKNTSPERQQGAPEAINRMGSNLGLMAQADNAAAEETPPSGDRKTAELFGARIASMTLKLRG